jgi:predicted DNA-binding WGR domain protein
VKARRKFGMAEPIRAEPARLQVILERVDPAKNAARYYVLSVEPTLFATHTLVRRWGRKGCSGRQCLQFFDGEAVAALALEAWLERKRRRGYAVK